MNNDKTTQNIESEISWHEEAKFYIDSGHWTSHPFFATRERHWISTHIEKIKFYGYLAKLVSYKSYNRNAKILIAPVGTGDEVQYLQNLFQEIHGIDISEKALSYCPRNIITKKGDILQSGYPDESFDIVICPLFLHHFNKVGFEPFLNEFYRLLKGGGILAIQEPSIFFPPTWLSIFLRLFIGNVTGLVPDEKPFNPLKLKNNLNKVGFSNIHFRGLSISHVRFPRILQAINLMIDYPIRTIFPLKLFCNNIGYYCEKNG